MKALFVGLGSIGCKHLKNLKAISPQITVHALRSGNGILAADVQALVDRQFTAIEQADTDYDICFITNPTNLHYDAIKDILHRTKAFFVEKPLFDEVRALPFLPSQTVYVAAPLRHTGVYKALCEVLTAHDVLSVRAVCSSYLPDWRPKTDYTQCYSAKKAMGGGVRLDLIHEWDYLCALFGVPQTVHCISRTSTALGIDSEDSADYIAMSGEIVINLHLDYYGHKTQRHCEIITRQGLVIANFAGGFVLDGDRRIDCVETANDKLYAEMRYFLDIIGGKADNTNDADNALLTLKVALN